MGGSSRCPGRGRWRPASAGNVVVVAQEEGGPAQRQPPPCVKEGESEGMDMRERLSGQGQGRRSLLVDASAAFVLSGAGALLAGVVKTLF